MAIWKNLGSAIAVASDGRRALEILALAGEAEADGADGEVDDPDAASKRLISWRGVAAATVASLLLALGGIWAYEAVVGHPLGDSGKSGTTFSNVGTTTDDDGKDDDRDKDGGTDPSPSSTPSTSGSDSDEPAPSDEASTPAEESDPQQSTPSTDPAPQPSATPSPEPAPQPDNLDEDPSLGQPSPAPANDEPTPSSFEG